MHTHAVVSPVVPSRGIARAALFFLALGPLLAQSAAAQSPARQPAEIAGVPARTDTLLLYPGNAGLDATRLTPGRVEYTWTTVRRGESRPLGVLTDQLTLVRKAGESVLQRVSAVSRGTQMLVDSTVMNSQNLSPISHRSVQPQRKIRLDFSGRRVSGAVIAVDTGSGGARTAADRIVDSTYASGVFDSGNWDLVIRAFALRPGVVIQYPAYDVDRRGPVMYTAHVVALETIDGHSTWRVSADLGSGRPATVWIDQATRALIRLETELAPGVLLRQERTKTAQSLVKSMLAARSTDSTDLINADRPGIADGSRVIQRLQLQVEVGLQHERRADGAIRTATTYVPMLIRFGLSERVELRVETNSLTATRTSGDGMTVAHVTGYSPVSIGAKYQIHDSNGEHRQSYGAIVRLFPPTGSSDFRSDRYTGDMRLAADWDFAPKLSLNPNLGLGLEEDSQGHTFVSALSALTLTYAPTDRINPFIDVGAQSPEAPAGATSVVLDAGIAYIIGRDFQVDMSAGRGVHGSTPPRPFVAVGISVRNSR